MVRRLALTGAVAALLSVIGLAMRAWLATGVQESLAATPGAIAPGGGLFLPADAQRGLVYKGLVGADPTGPCLTVFQIQTATGVVCTHGPDPSPPGVDVETRRSVPQLTADTDTAPSTALTSPTTASDSVPCIGDGASGDRVQAVYAHPAGTTSRYSTLLPLIRTWAADVDAVFASSAAQTGGTRHVRFVTDSSCQLVVLNVQLSSTGADTFQNTINELAAQGYKRSDRKYLVWMDANVYCGIGQVYQDDRASQDNYNNGSSAVPGMVARIDNGCWGLLATDHSVETHELVHTLGAVMSSSPNHSPNGHCLDESDTMCYSDAPGVVTRQVCSLDQEKLLDCKDDDYFNTAPASGSYLATHWNVANSAFLSATVSAPAAPPVIAGFTPAKGVTETKVTLTGSGFGGATRVSLNGLRCKFTVVSATQVTATVPAGATSGHFTVVTPAGTASSTGTYTVILSVTAFTPVSGPAGTRVTISGIGLTGATKVTFNGVSAPYSIVSSTQIRATVPSSATSGRIGVTTPAGTARSAGTFTKT